MERLRRILKVIVKRGNEYLPLLIALPIWWFSGLLTRMIDPTAGVDDAGLFQALIFGIVLYFAACAFSWLAMRIVFPIIGRFVDDKMGHIFSEGTDKKHQLWFALALFGIYFFGAIIIFASVVQ